MSESVYFTHLGNTMSLKPQKNGMYYPWHQEISDQEEEDFEEFVEIHDAIGNQLHKEIIHGVPLNIVQSAQFIEVKQQMDDAVTDYASFKANDWKFKDKKEKKRKHKQVKDRLDYYVTALIKFIKKAKKGRITLTKYHEPLYPTNVPKDLQDTLQNELSILMKK